MLKIIADDFVTVAIFSMDGVDKVRELYLNVVAKMRCGAFDCASTRTG